MPRGTRERRQEGTEPFAYGAVTLFGGTFQGPSARLVLGNFLGLRRAPPRNPPRTEALEVWAVPRSLAATDGIADLLSLPPGTEMVHFPGLALASLCIQRGISQLALRGVAPFGNPRIEACLRLPEAYRSLPRPSSLLCAKASTVHP